MKHVIVVRTALVLAMLPVSHMSAQGPTLQTVVDRACAYVAEFRRELSGIVAEEVYEQEEGGFVSGAPRASHRSLKSDFLLVRAADMDRYVEFRDVFEVNGQPVRDRAERLTRLFLNPDSASGQLRQIITESARYNLGNIRRNINTPTLALLFLDPAFRSRFSFSRSTDAGASLATSQERSNTGSSPVFRVSTEMWVVQYRETDRPTIIRTPEGRDMPARGRFWIDPATGRVLMSELIASDSTLKTTIDVSYQSEPLLGFLVPVQMRERYEGRNMLITGTATYHNFRRFGVKVDESVGPLVR